MVAIKNHELGTVNPSALMNEHLLKLLAAYAAGTAATAFLVRLVWLMPIEHYAKHLLAWVLPVPVILIVLVMLYYGPPSFAEGEGLSNNPSGLLRLFFFGALTTFGVYAAVPVVKFMCRRFTGAQDEEGEPEE